MARLRQNRTDSIDKPYSLAPSPDILRWGVWERDNDTHHAMSWRRLVRAAFSRYLLLTNIALSGATDGAGDILEQRTVERSRAHDWPRTARMAIIGLAFGPLDHYWYRLLDRYLPGRTPRLVVAKVMADMVLMGPVSIVLFYLGEHGGGAAFIEN